MYDGVMGAINNCYFGFYCRTYVCFTITLKAQGGRFQRIGRTSTDKSRKPNFVFPHNGHQTTKKRRQRVGVLQFVVGVNTHPSTRMQTVMCSILHVIHSTSNKNINQSANFIAVISGNDIVQLTYIWRACVWHSPYHLGCLNHHLSNLNLMCYPSLFLFS